MPQSFEWNERKESENLSKHGIAFSEAQEAFYDPKRVIVHDTRHSTKSEKRFFCFGKVGDRAMTVRFTMRGNRIRIFGAGYWREGRRRYEEANKVHPGPEECGTGNQRV